MSNDNIENIENIDNIFDNIIGQELVIDVIKNICKKKTIPNIIFCGNNGCGKTLFSELLIKNLYKNNLKEKVLKLTINNERGINTVRDKIKSFSNNQIKKNDDEASFKIILFDQADYITIDAQNALRRIMETTISLSRFIFLCNNINKLIEPIKSRCLILRLKNIDDSLKIKYYEKKYPDINLKIIKKLVKKHNGNLRLEINDFENIKLIIEKNKKNSNKIINKFINNNINFQTLKKIHNDLQNSKSVEDIYNIYSNLINDNLDISIILDNFYSYLIQLDSLDIKKKKEIIKYNYNYILNIANRTDYYINSIKYFINLKSIL